MACHRIATKAGGSLSTPGAEWQVKGAGDLDGDGKADIVFQNSDSGEVFAWLQNGLSTMAGGSIGTSGTAWRRPCRESTRRAACW